MSFQGFYLNVVCVRKATALASSGFDDRAQQLINNKQLEKPNNEKVNLATRNLTKSVEFSTTISQMTSSSVGTDSEIEQLLCKESLVDMRDRFEAIALGTSTSPISQFESGASKSMGKIQNIFRRISISMLD